MISTAVVAFHTRTNAYQLATQLGATVVMDHGEWGAGLNHRRAWLAANHHDADWVLVVEDDAILCRDFHTRLAALLPTAPTPVVSLYLGTSYPPHLVRHAHTALQIAVTTNQPWTTLPTMNHAVAIAIRQPLVDDMLATIDDRPIDEAIGAWAAQRDMKVSYSVPSLVDHADGPTVIAHPDGVARTRPRKAMRFAG